MKKDDADLIQRVLSGDESGFRYVSGKAPKVGSFTRVA